MNGDRVIQQEGGAPLSNRQGMTLTGFCGRDPGLAAGESTQLGSCLIPLPAGFHEKAVQYKIAFYGAE